MLVHIKKVNLVVEEEGEVEEAEEEEEKAVIRAVILE